MLKNYFIELGSIFKESGKFFVQNFKKYNLLIWLLIIAQVFLSIPVLYFTKEIGFANFSIWCKITTILMLVAFFVIFFFMFKKVFAMVSNGLSKPELSNAKIVKALLTMGLINCLPLILFLICYSVAQAFPIVAYFLKISLNIFTYIFYFAMSLSIASIVKWQDKNIFDAIFKSIKLFSKKAGIAIPVFLAFFLLASAIVFVTCALIYAICLYFNVLNENLANSIQAIINVYSLYVFAGLYIGAQVKIVEGADE